MTNPIKALERFCNTPFCVTSARTRAPGSSLMSAAKLPGRRAGPFLKCAMKRAALRKAQLQGDVHDASVRVAQIADGQVAAKVILDALIGRPLFVQTPAQRRGGHVQFACE